MKHSFDVAIAEDVGIKEAILLENIWFWCQKNKANGRHEHDGKYWTYNSAVAFTKLFPYMTADQIRYAIGNLVEKGYLITGNFNDTKYDRTTWYACTDKTDNILTGQTPDQYQKNPKSISDISEMEVEENQNGCSKNPKPIPDSKPDSKTDIKQDIGYAEPTVPPSPSPKRFKKPTLDEVKAYCQEQDYHVDAEAFIDHYECTGWIVGKKPMKDWKAAVRTWERNEKKWHPEEVKATPKARVCEHCGTEIGAWGYCRNVDCPSYK